MALPLARAEFFVAPEESLTDCNIDVSTNFVSFTLNDSIVTLSRRRSRIEPAADGTQVFALKQWPEGEALLQFRRSRQRTTIYLDNQPALSLRDFSAAYVVSNVSCAIVGETFSQPLGHVLFEDDFMVDKDDPGGLQFWEPVSGEWSLHSVTGAAVRVRQENSLKSFPTPEHSPNFYSLEGSGTNALILAGESFHSCYALEASVQHNVGTNGLAFLASEDADGNVLSCWTFCVENDPQSDHLRFVLRKDAIPGKSIGETIDGVTAEITRGQWLLLEVQISDNYITCLVDHSPLFSRRLALPAGGRFGLFTNSHIERETMRGDCTRFDDVACKSFTDIVLETAADFDYWRLAENIFGSTNDPAMRIELPVIPTGSVWRAELSIGDCRGLFSPQGLALMKGTNVLDTFESDELFSAAPFSLSLDGTIDGEICAKVNGQTVLWAPIVGGFRGAHGFALTGATNGIPSIKGKVLHFTDRYEKNNRYVTDPFMRHWASPQGQWLPYPRKNRTEYKSRVLRRAVINAPYVEGASLEVGDFKVVCESNTVSLAEIGSVPLAELPVFRPIENEPPISIWTLRIDDWRIYLTAGTNVVCSAVRKPGCVQPVWNAMPEEPLKYVKITREPVLDCLFTDSLHDWTINGGTWEIVNRFQCLPKWSHMNGENGDGLAALWSKFELGGDFAMEAILGMRHGWYERVGDFNVTLFNSQQSTGSGYTMTTAAWDPDHSQTYSRLFRDGKIIGETRDPTSPMRRHGNETISGYEPMRAHGRPVHGAWYTVALRRDGTNIVYSFDNVPRFTAHDPAPLSGGGFGVWTYRNSIVAARLRVACTEEPRPRTIKTRPIVEAQEDNILRGSTANVAKRASFNGLQANLFTPELWHADDAVSHPSIVFSSPRPGETIMRVTSLHGAGSFLARVDLPEISVNKISGWAFDVACSKSAAFNFLFETGTQVDGVFQPRTFYSSYICGTRESRGPRKMLGAERETTLDEKQFTPMTVWLPSEAYSTNLFVRATGFGNLQPSAVQQGLEGNPPGAWYEIRNFRPIYRDEPQLDVSTNLRGSDELVEILHKFTIGRAGERNSLQLPATLDSAQPCVEWTLAPARTEGLIANWTNQPLDSIVVRSTLEWPNPSLIAGNVAINGVPIAGTFIENDALIIPLPRPRPTPERGYYKLLVGLRNGRTFTQFLRPPEITNAAPILLSLTLEKDEKNRSTFQNFESRQVDFSKYNADRGNGSPFIRPFAKYDDEQGTFMRLANGGAQNRLRASLTDGRFNFAQWPLARFRYRGSEFATVALSGQRQTATQFAYPADRAKKERIAGIGENDTPAILDGTWRTWCGRIAQLDGTISGQHHAINYRRAFSPSLRIGSFYEIDQTGKYATLDVDDIALGPAIGPNRPLQFRALYDAADKIVEWSIDDGAQKGTCTNGAWCLPPTDKLAEGIHLLKIGNDAEVPFLIDRTPPQLTYMLTTPSLVEYTIDFDKGAPLDLNALALTVNGKELPDADFPAGALSVAFSPTSTVFNLKWPFLLRKEVQAATNGTPFAFSCKNVRDGAGNAGYDFNLNGIAKISYETDNTPPKYTEFKSILPRDLIPLYAQPPTFGNCTGFTTDRISEKGYPFIRFTITGNGGGRLRFEGVHSVNLAKHPWLGVSYRITKRPEGLSTNVAPFKLKIADKTFSVPDAADGKWTNAQFFIDASYTVYHMNIAFEDVKGMVVDIRLISLAAPWEDERKVNFSAWDESGIAGVFWQTGDRADYSVVRPAQITLPENDGLIELVIKDRAGNSSHTQLIPRPTRKPEKILSISEDW